MAVGLDIAKHDFQAALLSPDGRCRVHRFDQGAAGVQALRAWLRRHDALHAPIGMEATGVYSAPLAEALHAHGHRVSIINPARVKAYGRSELTRAKTDRVDARLIARFVAERRPAPWAPPPAAVRELQALHQRLVAVERMARQEHNRLETTAPAMQASIHRIRAALHDEIDQLKRAIRAHIRTHRCLRRPARLLRSIPGIGEAVVLEVLVRLPQIQRCRNVRAWVAQAGVDPRPYESGTSIQARAHLSKRGDATLRHALYMPSLCAMQHNPVIRAFVQRLRQRGKNGKAIACAAMRKLMHLIYGVLNSNKPFDPKLHLQT